MNVKYIIGLVAAVAILGTGITLLLLSGDETAPEESPDATSENISSEPEIEFKEVEPIAVNTSGNFTPLPLGGEGVIDIGQIAQPVPVSVNLTPGYSSANCTPDGSTDG